VAHARLDWASSGALAENEEAAGPPVKSPTHVAWPLRSITSEFTMSIATENLSGKVILEVDSGRGDTTRELVRLLAAYPDARLIAVDISDAHFRRLGEEFREDAVRIRFIQTCASQLADLESGSMDHIVCNYSLCAINSQPGLGVLALRSSWRVLKTGGEVFVEEEYPIGRRDAAGKGVWSDKWRILKAAIIIAGGLHTPSLRQRYWQRRAALWALETSNGWRRPGSTRARMF
jgi:SAM-dependent methyltransferase